MLNFKHRRVKVKPGDIIASAAQDGRSTVLGLVLEVCPDGAAASVLWEDIGFSDYVTNRDGSKTVHSGLTISVNEETAMQFWPGSDDGAWLLRS